MFSGCICGLASCVFPAPPIVNDNLGALLVPMFNRGTSLGGCAWPSSPTGLAFGDGGIPKDSFGVREPLWLRPWPGTGARKRGTGLVIVKGASLAPVRQLKYEAGWIESNGRCGLWWSTGDRRLPSSTYAFSFSYGGGLGVIAVGCTNVR